MFGKKEDYIGPQWMSLRDRLYNPDMDMEKFAVFGGDVETLDEYCNACGYCVRVCPAKTLELVPRKEPLKMGGKTITKVMKITEAPECVACGVCEAICPNDACYVSKPISIPESMFKTLNKGPLSLPRLFSEKTDDRGRTAGR